MKFWRTSIPRSARRSRKFAKPWRNFRGTLKSLTDLTGQLDQTLDVNSENIDQLLDNLLHVTENLKEFTETIKMRPYSLIRAENPPEHKTGGVEK